MAESAAGDSTRNAAPRAPVVAIVDDDPAIRSALSRLARSLGYAPAHFAGAEPLLKVADDAGIAVVVTDVQMPGLSGLDLLRLLRLRRALASGAFAYLAKPFDAEQFEHCLGSVLGITRDP